MHVADGPIGVVRQRVDDLHRHHRTFEGRHAVERDRHHHHAQHRIGAQFVPRARQRHDSVDHAAPGRHPQNDREGHAERLRPVRQRRVMQMMRSGPDVEEDQRPEMDDRQAIGIDRPVAALGNEVVHDREEAGGQEEADRVVAVPPLHHGVLHARPDDVGFRREHRNRHGGIVAEMQHRDGEDESEIEPVGDVDVRLGAPHDGAKKDQEIDHPHDRQEQVGVPFRLGIFLGLRNAEQIAGAGNDDEEIVAEHDKPRRDLAGQPRAAGALHDIERRRDQHVAAKREDHRRCVQRPQAAEGDPGQIEIENRKCQLKRDVESDGEAGNAPEHGGDGRELDRPHVVVGLAIDRQRRRRCRALVVAIDDGKHRRDAGGRKEIGVERVFRRVGLGGDRRWTEAPDAAKASAEAPSPMSWSSEKRARSPCWLGPFLGRRKNSGAFRRFIAGGPPRFP